MHGCITIATVCDASPSSVPLSVGVILAARYTGPRAYWIDRSIERNVRTLA